MPDAIPELPKQYRPSDHEPRVWDRWVASRAFHADPANVRANGGTKEPYSLLIPPPNVTAALHLGHALNNTLQDILARAHRMKGFETLWMPGTDHAGIATQAVVEKRVWTEEKKRRTDFQRDEFVAKIQAFKDEYEAVITGQLKAMGCSCDWDRQRFTMDPICARAVREAFFRLFKDGLIYRGKRLVNWDPALQTAVADDECYEEEVDTSFWSMSYPLEAPATLPDGSTITHITVATTRPETYLGDTGIAMNPKDPRAAALVGRKVILPLVGRVIPIIADAYAVLPEAMATTDEEKNDPKAKFSTGFVKMTPAHDFNDYEIGQRHGLATVNMMSPDGRVSDKHGWDGMTMPAQFVGKTMIEARKAVAQEFKALGLLPETRPYRQTKTFSDRSKAVIEPYLSDQWYVRVTDPRLAPAANAALVGEQRTTTSVGQASPPAHPTIPVTSNLQVHTRRLPHFQQGGSSYFVTFRLIAGELSPIERDTVLAACRHWDGEKCELHAAVVMPDHVHLIVSPFRKTDREWWSLSEILQGIKSFTAHKLNKDRGTSGKFWQDESYDRIIRDMEWDETVGYVLANPIRKKLVAHWREYRWTWAAEETLQRKARFADRWRRLSQACTGAAGGDACPTTDTDGSLRFYPARYAKSFEHWHDNIRDWCISRQLWWGHRIPVWTRRLDFTVPSKTDSDGVALAQRMISSDVDEMSPSDPNYVARFIDVATGEVFEPSDGEDGDSLFERLSGRVVDAHICVRDETWNTGFIEHLEAWGGFVRDPDVLDTWFSSALWPLSTMGWPDAAQAANDDTRSAGDFGALLKAFNPTTSLSTAREIITLWVSRMTMFNRYFRGQDLDLGAGHGPAPFRDVFIHAVIQDGEGRKMSKSLGNGVDPLDIIATHGSDAMRFTLCHMATNTQDVRLPVKKDPATGKNTSEKFDLGRNFATKLWNAAKFAMEKLQAPGAGDAGPVRVASLPDRWILSRLHATIGACNEALANYEFSVYAQTCYNFLWNDFCDWYLESIKPTVGSDASQRAVLRGVLDAVVRLLHPVMPFVTEVLFDALGAVPARDVPGLSLSAPTRGGTLCTAGWPLAAGSVHDAQAEAAFARVQALVTVIREVRAQHQVPFKRAITLHIAQADVAALGDGAALVTALCNLAPFDPGAPTGPSVPVTIDGRELRLSNLADVVDAGAERDRLARQVADLTKSVATLEGRLANPGYALKAPPHMVQQTKDQLAKAQAELAASKAALEALA